MNWKQVLSVAGISAVTAVLSVVAYTKITGSKSSSAPVQYTGKLPANYANYDEAGSPNNIDFTSASQAVIPAVVHIKTKIKQKTAKVTSQRNPFFDDPFFDQFQDFFNQGSPFQRVIPEQRASGSGVIITGDGYILTNNHVIEGADEVTVTLSNKKSYKAKVIGSDPASDLGVIKIDGNDFPSLVYGNSDDVKIGQWVLAVGYPLALDCSVTAGIVSAKARSLGLNQERVGANKSAIESYIQTDAAVNKGNSGGALVNARGELIGINAAIASPTGYYAGYSYAIPINIAKKIASDLMKHGSAQRAFLGVRPAIGRDISGEQEIKDGKGVEIGGAADGGAAAAAGLKGGDIITKINGKEVQTWNELVEQVAAYSVGDKINITYVRNGKENTVNATLKNESGNFEVLTKQTLAQELGADLENLDAKKANEYGIEGGVVLKGLNPKGLLKSQNPSMKAGLVIIKVNGVSVSNVDELSAAIESGKNSTIIQGFYPGTEGIYHYVLNKNADQE
ncbi:MAG: trypsin-like peptidase domain-containing protein [Dinghuibacter sp.]|nr:trypsin-like peptidase domain-containing protein [Dinghuibacter sp.]